MRSRTFSTQPGSPPSGPLGKLLAYALGGLLLAAAVMFSLVVLAVAAIAGSAWLAYFWWKTRKLRKAMMEHPPGGHVIEGEAIIVESRREAKRISSIDAPEDR